MEKIRDFNDLGVEPETRLLSRKIVKLNEIDCVHEYWSWDGVSAESLIFYSDDVKDISDAEIAAIIAPFKSTDTSHTLNRKEKYTFLNFNFEVD